jgi:hypothetical protein
MKCNEDTNKEYIKRRISKGKSDAFDVLPTLLTQYGRFSYKSYSMWLNNDSVIDGYHNHIDYIIEGFVQRNNRTYVKVSWQLDNADGESLVEMPGSYSSAKVEINANLYFYVDSDDIYQAIKNLKF